MTTAEDALLAASLQRELNGLGRRGRATTKPPLYDVDVVEDDASHRKSSHRTASTKKGKHLEASSSPQGLKQKKQRVASRPVVFHEETRLWYRVQVTHRRPGEVKVSWDGRDDLSPVWLEVSSARIWRGSMRNKDWKYVSNGGWLPKQEQAKPKAGVQNPSTPPLASPHHSDAEPSTTTTTTSDLEETAQKIEWDDSVAHSDDKKKRAKKRRSADAATTTLTKSKKQKKVKIVAPKRVKAEESPTTRAPPPPQSQQQHASLPIKLLLKKAYKAGSFL